MRDDTSDSNNFSSLLYDPSVYGYVELLKLSEKGVSYTLLWTYCCSTLTREDELAKVSGLGVFYT